jgi:hypothetical protein
MLITLIPGKPLRGSALPISSLVVLSSTSPVYILLAVRHGTRSRRFCGRSLTARLAYPFYCLTYPTAMGFASGIWTKSVLSNPAM